MNGVQAESSEVQKAEAALESAVEKVHHQNLPQEEDLDQDLTKGKEITTVTEALIIVPQNIIAITEIIGTEKDTMVEIEKGAIEAMMVEEVEIEYQRINDKN